MGVVVGAGAPHGACVVSHTEGGVGMSILKSTSADFGGAVLPAGVYRATVLEAKHEETENGKRLTRMYGNLRTPAGEVEFPNGDGITFRIGNRKLFARSWTEHKNEKAQE